jgi:HAMP domain-containing protein
MLKFISIVIILAIIWVLFIALLMIIKDWVFRVIDKIVNARKKRIDDDYRKRIAEIDREEREELNKLDCKDD